MSSFRHLQKYQSMRKTNQSAVERQSDFIAESTDLDTIGQPI